MQQLQTRKISKIYEIGTTSTLVDLNQDLTNFVAEFKVYPTNDKSKTYKIAVVDQTHIDNSEIEYKDVTGDIGATVSWEKGVYKNHYIALKATESLEVTVDIELKELPKKKGLASIDPQGGRGDSQEMQPIEPGKKDKLPTRSVALNQGEDDLEYGENEYERQVLGNTKSDKFKNIWFKISVGCICLIIAILLWKFFISPSKKSNRKPIAPEVYVPSFERQSRIEKSPKPPQFKMATNNITRDLNQTRENRRHPKSSPNLTSRSPPVSNNYPRDVNLGGIDEKLSSLAESSMNAFNPPTERVASRPQRGLEGAEPPRSLDPLPSVEPPRGASSGRSDTRRDVVPPTERSDTSPVGAVDSSDTLSQILFSRYKKNYAF